ncbi:DUF2252 domain-containing protein [Tunturiibacter gelidoferens]|uniref:Uncharacterized protein (DUF2252 family) n=1 Tax=Tunturiibacter gelidiferens TaxID=3069689 RepID=A0ACC5P300_9BACT|nr:DUF2252 domain-containing protein [Edaphobacter lichenicola]MBB5341049.1 uncharacterized protein (DUF2252 family) [Edaphobacter lichenicola]
MPVHHAKRTVTTERVNLRKPRPTIEALHEQGTEMREHVPREMHGQWKPSAKRGDVLSILAKSNVDRQQNLVPLRMQRMSASPFAFLRGAAAVMAYDLSTTPTIGCNVVLAGDAHLSNFGFYGTPQRELVFDINDFDETVIGPWEWDLKRLTASVNVAGRENGLTRNERRVAVMLAVEGYQENMERLEPMGTLDIWYLHATPGKANILRKVPQKALAVMRKVTDKALHSDNRTLLTKVADKNANGQWHFREDPPILTHVSAALRNKIITALEDYSLTLSRERRHMLSRYSVADVAHRVVGVGSVGTRTYLALLMGKNDDDPLFLQIKEALSPAHAAYLPSRKAEFIHEGQRVVVGQRTLQAASDVMLGWTEIEKRPYYVRQMKNLKASVPIEWMSGDAFNFYCWACGALLARAHARTSEPAIIAGYCGRSGVLRESYAEWAEAYGDQTVTDHAKLAAKINAEDQKLLRNR